VIWKIEIEKSKFKIRKRRFNTEDAEEEHRGHREE
jgi:hypothetical protein